MPYCVQASSICSESQATVVSIQGKVDTQASKNAFWNSVNIGHNFCYGDKIRTSKHSKVTLVFKNGSRMTLKQNSTLSFASTIKKETSWIVRLIEGSGLIRSRHPQRLNVQTPFINAVHEGTEFLVTVNSQQTEITVFDGQVAAGNQMGQIHIKKGYTGIAPKSQPPYVQALTIKPEDAVQWSLYYPPIINVSSFDQSIFQPSLEAYQQGNPYHALTLLEKTATAKQDVAHSTLKASLLLILGSVDEAISLIDQTLLKEPKNSSAIALQSIIAVTKNRQDKAFSLAQKAVALDPQSATAQIALSYAHQAQFKITTALKATKEAVRLSPDNALAWARLAELQLSTGERNTALESAQKAESLNPALGRTQTVLGFNYLAQINIDQAKTAFVQAIKLNSADPLAHLGLGLAKIRKGAIEKGTRDIETAVSLDPDNAIMRSYLGKAYYELRNDEYAATELGIAKEVDPNDPTPWFYDAIRKQTTNRPVEALHDMQKAIELNDNRGVYRSKLLLDDDLAARAVSLARIFDNLGFDQPAVNQSSKSLNIDPSNYSAHRFLSDTYLKRPRHEAARSSELLQAQLLQPIIINPIQPEASETNLNILADTSPSNAGFNEFTSLFESNSINFLGSAIVGNNNTIADQAVLSGVLNNFSYSFGQFHYSTDGFRENNELRHNIYNAFVQMNLTNSLNLQFEYRNRNTEEGDLRLRFDPNNFSVIHDREVEQEIFRVGGRYALNSKSQFIASFQYINRDEKIKDFGTQGRLPAPPLRKINETRHGYDIQAQYIFKRDSFNFILGGGAYDFEGNHQRTFNTGSNFDELLFDANVDISGDWREFYFYSNLLWPNNITWTFGLSYVELTDTFNKALDLSNINPKLGINWEVSEWVSLRFAAFQTTKRSLISKQSLSPTQIAGFSQQLDDFNGTHSKDFGGGIDFTPTKNLFFGFEFSTRELEVPFTFTRLQRRPENVILTKLGVEEQRENLYKAYLQWTPHTNWVLSAEYSLLNIKRNPVSYIFEGSRRENKSLADLPTKLETTIVPFGLRYFDPSGFFSSVTATYVKQKSGIVPATNLKENGSDFFLIDMTFGYRLPKKLGIINLQVKNIFDQNFNYYDTNIQTSEATKPLFIPDRAIIGQIIINY
jgi:tetratricopeptide (TPR) repeat protein